MQPGGDAAARAPRSAVRSVLPERMDDPGIAPEAHRRALAGLARLNRISGSARLLHRALADLLPRRPGPALTVLDVAAGGGDVAVGIWRRAARRGQVIDITGVDRSPLAVAEATARAARAGATVRFVRLDACTEPLPAGRDVVMTSLFLHHLEDAPAIDLLRRMKDAARRRVIVNDLIRSSVSESLVRVASHLLSRSPVVHADGPQSVRAAFTPAELRDLADRAGLRGARVRTAIGCRLLLTWDVK